MKSKVGGMVPQIPNVFQSSGFRIMWYRYENQSILVSLPILSFIFHISVEHLYPHRCSFQKHRGLLWHIPILYPSPYISLLYCANSTCKIPLKSVHISPDHPQLFLSRSASLLTWTCAEVSPLPLSSTSQPFSMKSEMALKYRSDHITVLLQTLQLHLR